MCHPSTKDEVLPLATKDSCNLTVEAETRASRLAYVLKTAAWIPQLDEADVTTFVTPAKATPGLLPENFKYNDKGINAWLTAIEFGKEESERVAALRRQEEYASSEYQAKVNTAKNNNFDSPEEMEAAAAFVQEAKKQGKSLTELHADLT